MIDATESFSADYQSARALFRAAASAAQGELEAIEHPERGPDGAPIFTDIAWVGPKSAENVLVLISGTHGVEGFCGSGAQIDWLRRGGAEALPTGVAALLIHAINPYGFAWLRRVTHENVDLNRNWVDFDQGLRENPGYDDLAEALCPADWSPETVAGVRSAVGAYAQRHGVGAMLQAISGGQYRHPHGLFYGGAGAAWSRRTQTAILTETLAQAGRAAIIDYHTGLGPWGYGEQILSNSRGTPGFARAARWFGAAVTSTKDGSSTSADIAGDGLDAAPKILPGVEVTSMALEVGTHPAQTVLEALIADNWLHARGDVGSPLGRSIKSAIRDAFYGDRADWKGMVAGQSLLACRQALAGLTSK